MGDAFVAVDAGLAFLHCLFHYTLGNEALRMPVHGLPRMAVAAFVGIIGFHLQPDMYSKFLAAGFEFFPRVDGTCEMMPVWSKNSIPAVEIQENAAAQFPETDLKQVLWETRSGQERRKSLI